ncbi:MAG: hypothetical protein JKY03_00630 [Aureispira sp.]|nr:hypothetical protein [Aureispira sp.]
MNGKVVEEVNSKTSSGGAFETDFNVVIGDGDTIISRNETPRLNPKIVCTQSLSAQDVEALKVKISQVFLDKNRILTAKIIIND